MQVWRICKGRYAEAAFSGEGARLYSGRWNPAGIRMVYTSSSLSLAALELFVHLDPTVAPDDLVSVSAEIPASLKIERIAAKELPQDWCGMDNEKLHDAGSRWIAQKRSAVLQVPSAVIDGEWNILLNPEHADFPCIRVAAPVPFYFDKRMFR